MSKGRYTLLLMYGLVVLTALFFTWMMWTITEENKELKLKYIEFREHSESLSQKNSQLNDVIYKLQDVITENQAKTNRLQGEISKQKEEAKKIQEQLKKENVELKKKLESKAMQEREKAVASSHYSSNKDYPVVSRGKPSSSKRTITVEATAYTAFCDTGCTGVTATGINLGNNRNAKVIAVDPKVIPLGTKVYVEGYGYAIAGDTGGAIKGNIIDLHVPTTKDAINWGRRTVKVTILK
jgi:3D (Asp-Asp-Asp) domain-containing protein/DNA-binding protein H-NS